MSERKWVRDGHTIQLEMHDDMTFMRVLCPGTPAVPCESLIEGEPGCHLSQWTDATITEEYHVGALALNGVTFPAPIRHRLSLDYESPEWRFDVEYPDEI